MMIDANAVNVPPVPNSMSGTNGGLPTSFFSARSTYCRSFATCFSVDAPATSHCSVTRTAPSFVSYTWSTNPDDASTISVLPPPMSATATSRPEISNARATLRNASRASSSAEITSIESLQFLANAIAELAAILGVAKCAGADRANLARAEAGGDRQKVAEHGDRGVRGGRIEPVRLRHRGGQARVFPLFVQHAIAAGREHFRHHQPNAVGADVNGRDSSARLRGISRRVVCIHHDTCRGLPVSPRRQPPWRRSGISVLPNYRPLANGRRATNTRSLSRVSCRFVKIL